MALPVVSRERGEKGGHGLGGHGVKCGQGAHGKDSGAFRRPAEILSQESRRDSGPSDEIRKEVRPFFHREGLSGEVDDKDSIKTRHPGPSPVFVRARTW